MAWRALAQRVLTGEWLDLNVEIKNASMTRELSGPGGVSGNINPELFHDKAPDGRPIIEEWSTALYVVEDDQIRAGGIVKSGPVEGGVKNLDAPGFTTYPYGQPHLGNYTPTDWEDPVRVIQNLWAHLTSFPDGDVGIQVVGPATYMRLSDGAGPYNFLEADQRDVGQEIENVLTAASLEYVEEHVWLNSAKSAVIHRQRLGFPRLGTRRTDLRFAQDENVVRIGTISADGERFSNDVLMLGNGEGYAQPRGRSAVRDGRLRRAVVVTDKNITTNAAAARRANFERLSRDLTPEVAEFTIRDTPMAPIGAVQPGDDVLLEYDLPHIGEGRVWLRVLAIEETTDAADLAVLKVMRADAFTYPSATNPNTNGDPFIVTV